MQTSVVIPLKSNTPHNCLELKYSLRSLEKYLENVGEVFIVSDSLPDWITNVTLIYNVDYRGTKLKEANIASKFCSACLDERVSNPFLASNDDVYLTSNFIADTFPNFYYGTLQDRLKLRKPSEIYYQSMANTVKVLEKAHRDTLFFDVHAPILYDKEQFVRIIKSYSWDRNAGYVIKSLYGNIMQLDGIEFEDCKLRAGEGIERSFNRPFFSNCNRHINSTFWEYLERLFPNKSKYEK